MQCSLEFIVPKVNVKLSLSQRCSCGSRLNRAAGLELEPIVCRLDGHRICFSAFSKTVQWEQSVEVVHN